MQFSGYLIIRQPPGRISGPLHYFLVYRRNGVIYIIEIVVVAYSMNLECAVTRLRIYGRGLVERNSRIYLLQLLPGHA